MPKHTRQIWRLLKTEKIRECALAGHVISIIFNVVLQRAEAYCFFCQKTIWAEQKEVGVSGEK